MSTLLKDHALESGTGVLATKGKPLTYTLGKKSEKPLPQLKGENLLEIQCTAGLSDRSLVRVVASKIIQKMGRRAVEANLSKVVSERSHMLDEYYDSKL